MSTNTLIKCQHHKNALEKWIQLLGAQNVLSDENSRAQYCRTTGDKGTSPLAILFPISTEEVRKIVSIASQFRIPVHPISRGKNWGYGDACAATEGQVIIDFKRMNRIIEVNTRLGYAEIEPGVTQGQLSDYLKKHKTGLWMDATGAGPQASIVGNALERGYGHTHYGDHFKSMCGLEVVMANGEILRTGFGHFQNSKASHVYSYGVGPSIDGLFTQSNLGIITRMGIWLSPEPEEFLAFICRVETEREMLDVIDKLSHLRMRGVLQSTVHIGNDLRLISSRGRFPWDLENGERPLSEKLRAELREKYQAKRWTFTGAIYGNKAHIQATRKTLEKTLAPLKLKFLNDKTFEKANRLHATLKKCGLAELKFSKNLRQQVDIAKPLFDLLKGIPTEETLKGSAWRLRGPIPEKGYDPLNAGAGILWQAPVLPATSTSAQEVLGLIQPLFEKYGFDCPITFAMINERALTCVTNLFFDKSNPREVQRALDCYRELTGILINNGYYPYRTSAQGARRLQATHSPYWQALRQIKKALDPLNIISPGHYIPLDRGEEIQSHTLISK